MTCFQLIVGVGIIIVLALVILGFVFKLFLPVIEFVKHLITGRPEIIEIKDNQIGVLEEKGQFKKLCQQNTYKVYPHQRLHIIETGEQKIDLKHKILRSYDNIDVDTEGYYTYIIIDPVNALYVVANLNEAIKIILIKHILDAFEDF